MTSSATIESAKQVIESMQSRQKTEGNLVPMFIAVANKGYGLIIEIAATNLDSVTNVKNLQFDIEYKYAGPNLGSSVINYFDIGKLQKYNDYQEEAISIENAEYRLSSRAHLMLSLT